MVTDMLEDENEKIRSAFIDARECLSNEDVKDKRLRLRLQICGGYSLCRSNVTDKCVSFENEII